MPQKRLSRELIIQKAVEMVSKDGIESLGMQSLARKLGVKAPSLYNHIKKLDELHGELSAEANSMLRELIKSRVRGKRGSEALRELARAYREFAFDNPGLYLFSATRYSTSERWYEEGIALRDLFRQILSENFELTEEELSSSARALRSLMHGFILVELQRGWSKIIDDERSYFLGMDILIHGIASLNR